MASDAVNGWEHATLDTIAGWRLTAVFGAEGNAVATTSLAISSDSRLLVSGGRDGVRLWDLATLRRRAWREGPGRVRDLALSPADDLLATVSGAGIEVVALASGQRRLALDKTCTPPGTASPWAIAFAGDDRILTGHEGGRVVAWDLDGRVRWFGDWGAHRVRRLHASPDGRLCAWLDAQGHRIVIHDAQTGERRSEIPSSWIEPRGNHTVVWEDDVRVLDGVAWGDWLCHLDSGDHRIAVHRLNGAERVGVLPVWDWARRLVSSPDDRYLVCAAHEAIFAWRRTEDGRCEPLRTFGPPSPIEHLAFADANGTRSVVLVSRRFCSDGRRSEIALDRLTTRHSATTPVALDTAVRVPESEIADDVEGRTTPRFHQWMVDLNENEHSAIAFSADESRVLAAGHPADEIGGSATLWDLTTEQASWRWYRPGVGDPRSVGFVGFADLDDGPTSWWHVCTEWIGHGVLAVAISPDGRVAAGGLADGWLVVWDASDGRVVREHRIDCPIVQVAFGDDSATVHALSPRGWLAWSLADGALLGPDAKTRIPASLPVDLGPLGDLLSASAVSADGRSVAFGTAHGMVLLYQRDDVYGAALHAMYRAIGRTIPAIAAAVERASRSRDEGQAAMDWWLDRLHAGASDAAIDGWLAEFAHITARR